MSYHHFTPIERGKIEGLWQAGKTVRSIARQLDRTASSICRELRRGSTSGGCYCARRGQKRYEKNRKECVRTHALDHPPLRAYVQDKLTDDWSPEQISGRLKRDFPNDARMNVSTETIYRRIYTDRKWNNAFSDCLRQGRKTRRRREGIYKRRGPAIANKVSIDERPKEVDELTTYGHWEGDTLIGKNQQGALVTLTERKGDWLKAIPVASRRANEVAEAVIEALKDIPAKLRKTITFDNGLEFAHHEKMGEELGMEVYFAHPYSSNERARNENTNGLLRQYLPKKSSFIGLTKHHVNRFVEALNNRPRKKQMFRTPNEVFKELCVALEI